ncbi:hypothetical protein NHQ30_000892 [Ciborinia camelliae]|nr:hypothetical protein NHQ30_000892 [Ciborinia camelliae]
MVLNTASVGAAVAPVLFQTFITHYFQRGSRKEKPTAHISYDEGLNLIRKFLVYASHHTVEDIQRFTSQRVPHPPYVKVDEVVIPNQYMREAGTHVQSHLVSHGGITRVGGEFWWKWRRPGSDLKAEWIEMKADYQERTKNGGESKRIMLYVHGGAYYFGSPDEHRYQMQRHARKLKAKVFAPRYRLAPQFPFPCGLYDCLAAYIYLLSVQDPTTIILAGDSAGGGMVLSMLVIMRDTGIPLPAGAVLISPWVDLTHSFPSVAEDNPLDYIPAHGFHQRPSAAWPPPNADDIRAMERGLGKDHGKFSSRQVEADAVQGFHVDRHPPSGTKNNTAAAGPSSDNNSVPQANTVPGFGRRLSIMIDGELVVIKDQIQMYATNQQLSHPLVSPVLQPSLGGLPPLLILTGGGEMLRDEQIYIAHKAANPTRYPPGDTFLDSDIHNDARSEINRWKPTDVQLQVWDDLCHVTPTLSFTRPAKYMYRSIAQFGAWALARAQDTQIEILDDDNVSVISQSSDSGEDVGTNTPSEPIRVGKAGDSIPDFKDHMIRQRIDRHGKIFPLAPASELPACNMSPDEIGVIKAGPVKKWMAAKIVWDTKYSNEKLKVQKTRAKEMAKGYEKFGREIPPPSALAARRVIGVEIEREKEGKRKKGWGLSMWSGWGTKHDVLTMDREAEADKAGRRIETSTANATHGAGARDLHDKEVVPSKKGKGRAVEERSVVLTEDKGPCDLTSFLDPTVKTVMAAMEGDFKDKNTAISDSLQHNGHASASGTSAAATNEGGEGLTLPDMIVKSPTIERDNEEGVVRYNSNGEELRRPTANGIAFPFALSMGGVRDRNASNGLGGREASASLLSLVSVRDPAPEGFEWHFDDDEGYVLVKKEEENRKGKGKENENENSNVGAEDEVESSGVGSSGIGGIGGIKSKGLAGEQMLAANSGVMKGEPEEVDSGEESKSKRDAEAQTVTDTDAEVHTGVNDASVRLSAVGVSIPSAN